MRRSFTGISVALVVLSFTVSCATSVFAKKPDTPGGAKATFRLIRLAPSGISISSSQARDLDQAGNVVGFYESEGQNFGFHYDTDADSWQLFGAGVKLTGLNDLGEIVGFDQLTGDALYWSSPADTNPVSLSPLPGDQVATALRINNAGMIVGESFGNAEGATTAVAWAVDEWGVVSQPIVLPPLTGDTSTSVKDLNEMDGGGVTQIVGGSGTSFRGDAAVAWAIRLVSGTPAVVSGTSNIGSLDGAPAVAYGNNNLGSIVGRSGGWPFLKLEGQTPQPLSGLRKATDGFAMSISDSGVIVGDQGYLSRGRYVLKAVLWEAGGTVQELDKMANLDADETLESGVRINSAGFIIGSGYFPAISESDVGFLLVPLQ